MKKFNFVVYTRFQLIQLGACLLLGLIIGLSGGLTIMGRKVDHLTIENQRLVSEAREMETRLERLEASLAQRRQHIIRSIKVEINHPQERIRLELQDVIQGLLKELVGREVRNIDPPLLEGMITGRVITIDEQDYLLTLTASHITETMTLYIDVALGKMKVSD
ncbi:MAG: hypothetical protein ACOYD6_02705 [Limnochordia bacterium]|jgi:hypothetical protein